MRKLTYPLLCFTLVAGCASPGEPAFDSYYPASAPLDSITRAINHDYDNYRAYRHGISPNLAGEIRLQANQHSIPLGLAFSLISVESSFRVDAVSHAGAIGLTQVMPATGRAHCDLSSGELFQPEPNLRCGFSYLQMLHDRLRKWDLALAAYNVGDARRVRAPLTGEPDGSGYAAKVIAGG